MFYDARIKQTQIKAAIKKSKPQIDSTATHESITITRRFLILLMTLQLIHVSDNVNNLFDWLFNCLRDEIFFLSRFPTSHQIAELKFPSIRNGKFCTYNFCSSFKWLKYQRRNLHGKQKIRFRNGKKLRSEKKGRQLKPQVLIPGRNWRILLEIRDMRIQIILIRTKEMPQPIIINQRKITLNVRRYFIPLDTTSMMSIGMLQLKMYALMILKVSDWYFRNWANTFRDWRGES